MFSRWFDTSDLSPGLVAFLALLAIFFGAFLVYPLLYVFLNAFYQDGQFSTTFFGLMLQNPVQQRALINSFELGIAATIATTIISLPIAYALVRFDFPGKGILGGLMLIPMVMPPFVGAIGMRQMFARFGSVNLLLLDTGIIETPIDWFGGGGFLGVVVLEALHLYPLMYLNIAAGLANVDPSLEESARNVGASGFRLFRTVTFPLMLPGYFAGAIIVFIWAFTDLGTPLIFEYREVVSVQIFNMVTDVHENPIGFALVVLVLLLTLILVYLSKKFFGGRRYEMIARGHVVSAARKATRGQTALIYFALLSVTAIALIPHASVVLTSISDRWFMTVLPSEYTGAYYSQIFDHDLTLLSIKNSLFLSVLSTIIDVVLGVMIAYVLTRRRFPFKDMLDALTMLPLALPGLVLAFGYVAGFSGTWFDVRESPVPLLIIAYAVRRLPYMVRAAYAGFQQTSIALEEASMNLGAGPFRTLWKITLPLVVANLVAGAILSFSFAMLEVSDSLILAVKEQYYPITKAIYALMGRIADGPYMASAMGMLGMALLAGSLIFTGKVLGKKMGELFKV
ncbi:MAG: iron ABC transporter permease [Candidatus Latescibacteria bacterium]|nr:iron ABC transporter permease [Candidatus Latescibacterota bacterium]